MDDYNGKLAKCVARSKEEIVWVAIKGYEDSYVVNQFGQVKSLDRLVNAKGNGVHMVRGKLKRLTQSSERLCFQVRLNANNKSKAYVINRIVAEAFLGIDRNDRAIYVTRISDDDLPSYYKNLKVTYRKETKLGSIHKSLRYNSTAVHCYNDNGDVLNFDSITDVRKFFEISSTSTIHYRIKHPHTLYDGWYFSFIKPKDNLNSKRNTLLRLLKAISLEITIKNKDDVMNKTRTTLVAEELDCITKIFDDSYTLPKFNKEYRSRSSDNLTVICPIHGQFKSSLSALLLRSGCPECGKLRRTISRRTTGLDTKGKADHSFSELMNLYNFIRHHSSLVRELAHKDDYETSVVLYDLYLQSLVSNTVTLPSGKSITLREKQVAKLIRTTEEHAAIIATEVLIDKIVKGKHKNKNKNKNSPVTTLADVATIVDRRNDPQLAKKVIKRVHSDSFEFPKFDSEYKTNQSVLTAECVMPGHGTFQTTLANISNLKGCPKCVEMLNDLAGKIGSSIKARLELQKIYRAERLSQQQVIDDKRKSALLVQTEVDASKDISDDIVNIELEPVLSFTDRMMDSALTHTSNDVKQVTANPCETVSLISEPMVGLISKPFGINNTGFERETQDDVDEVFSIVERPVKPPVVVDEEEVIRTRHALKLLALYEKYEAQGYEMIFKKDDKELVITFKPS